MLTNYTTTDGIEIDLTTYPAQSISRFSRDNKRYYNTPTGPVPSVTTILSNTMPVEKREGLAQWRKSIGEAKANEITKRSTSIGTVAHAQAQELMMGRSGLPSGTRPPEIRTLALDIGTNHYQNHILPFVTKIYGIEVDLWADSLFAGACDAIVEYDGVLAIYDIKTARKCRSEDHVADYFLQVAAYALAFEQLYNQPIEHGVIALTTHAGVHQRWLINPDEMTKFKNLFLDRVSQYYSM